MTKLLYVDHDLSRVAEVTELLSRDFNLETAFTGWEGLGSSMLYHPNIVLLNLDVIVMDGLELLRLLRTEKELEDLPVISFSPLSDRKKEDEAIKLSSAGTVQYPFNKDQLSDMIKRCCPPS